MGFKLKIIKTPKKVKSRKQQVKKNAEKNENDIKTYINKSTPEFSKVIMNRSMLEAWLFTLVTILLSIKCMLDSTIGVTIITVSWASYTAGKILYYQKAKAENLYKLRLEFLKFKLKKIKDTYSVSNELDEIDENLKQDINEVEDENISEQN